MYTENDWRDYELSHHGILGMRWGKLNGPPYPLGSGDHSASEKKAGWRKSLGGGRNEHLYDRNDDKKEKRGLTDKQKRAIKIGLTAAGVALAAYGGYKLYQSGALDGLIKNGSKTVKDVAGDIKVPDIDKVKNDRTFAKSVNDYYRTPEGKNNCVPANLGGCLKMMGFNNVKVKPNVSPKGTDTYNKILECFNGVKEGKDLISGNISPTIAKGRDETADFLKRKFGDNATGILSFHFREDSRYYSAGPDGGHDIFYNIKNGVVNFIDFQPGVGDDYVSTNYFTEIDPNKSFTAARVDHLIPNMEALREILDFD